MIAELAVNTHDSEFALNIHEGELAANLHESERAANTHDSELATNIHYDSCAHANAISSSHQERLHISDSDKLPHSLIALDQPRLSAVIALSCNYLKALNAFVIAVQLVPTHMTIKLAANTHDSGTRCNHAW